MWTKRTLLLIIALIFISLTNSVVVGEESPEEKPATNVPQILSQGGEIIATIDKDLELPCEVKDLGEYVILWKFNKTQVLFAGNLRIHRDDRIHRNDKTASLLIKRFQLENAGEYNCQVSTNPPQDIIYNVKVIAPPQIRPDPENGKLAVNKGDPIRLSCEIRDGSTLETTKIEWRKFKVLPHSLPQTIEKSSRNQKTLALNTTELLISKADRNDAGIYECVAQNQIGQTVNTFHVKVLSGPEVQIDDKECECGPNKCPTCHIHAPVGQSTKITCKIHAEPETNVFWRKISSSQWLSTNQKYRLERDNTSATLLIRDVSEADYDNYSCVANNSLGSSSQTIEITGKPSKPKFTSAQIAYEGNRYAISWTLTSETNIKAYNLRIRQILTSEEEHPPQQWQHYSVEPIDSPTEENSSPHQRSQTFNIENLIKDATYEVDLVAENDFGQSRSEIFSFVTSADPNGATRLLSTYNFHLSAILALTPILMVSISVRAF